MGTVAGISVKVIAFFIFIVITQIGGSSMLAKTDGFRSPVWTAACLATYFFSFWAMAAVIRQGMPLSLLIPLMTAVIPLAVICIGVFAFGEAASFTKIAVLGAACVAVGLASAMK
jgi:multidrug transporter EmrE-like cation transporter